MRRALGRQGPDFDQRAVRAERAQHAYQRRRSLERRAGVEHRVLRREGQERARLVRAVKLGQLGLVLGQGRVAGVDAGLGAQHAVAVGQNLGAHIGIEAVARAEGQQLLHGERGSGVARGQRLADIAGRGGRRFVRGNGMHRVVDVLEVHLPIASHHVAQRGAHHFQLAHWRARHHIVQRGQHGGIEIAVEVRPRLAQAHEHEALVIAHTARFGQALGRRAVGQAGAFVVVLERHRHQLAVELVGPRVIGAAQELARIALAFMQQLAALVRAAVQAHGHRAVGLAQHDERLAGDLGRVVVARPGHQAGVAQEDPGTLPQPFLFEPVDPFADVNVAMDAVGLNQAGHRFVTGVRRHMRRLRHDDPREACQAAAAGRTGGHTASPVSGGTAAIRARVYSCCGELKTCSVSPASTTTPRCMTMTRLHR